MVSNVQKVIPQSVQDKWHEFRHGAKEASPEEGAPAVEGAERVGWGVKEADARTAQEGASEFVSICSGGETDTDHTSETRLSNAAGAGVRHPQELHLCESASDGGHSAQGGQGAQRMGLGDRQEEGKTLSAVFQGTCLVKRTLIIQLIQLLYVSTSVGVLVYRSPHRLYYHCTNIFLTPCLLTVFTDEETGRPLHHMDIDDGSGSVVFLVRTVRVRASLFSPMGFKVYQALRLSWRGQPALPRRMTREWESETERTPRASVVAVVASTGLD